MRLKINGRCACRVCKIVTAVARIQKKLSKRERAVLETLMLEWGHSSTDATHYRMRLNGTWPTDETRVGF
jgi:hypothetical protein